MAKNNTQVIGALFLLMIAYFFFASIHAAFLGLFFDDLLDAIRNRHYPQSEWLPPPSLSRSLRFASFHHSQSQRQPHRSAFYLIGWFVPPIGLAAKFWSMATCSAKNTATSSACAFPPTRAKPEPSFSKRASSPLWFGWCRLSIHRPGPSGWLDSPFQVLEYKRQRVILRAYREGFRGADSKDFPRRAWCRRATCHM